MIQLVFAHAGQAFGSEDGMPWEHIPQDFKNFKARTENTILIMGANTFASLPGLLSGRKHVVLCDMDRVLPLAKNGDRANKYLSIYDLDNLLKKWKNSNKLYSVIGGADILKRSLPFAWKVIETEIKVNVLETKLKPVTRYLSREFLNELDNMPIVTTIEYPIDNKYTIVEIIR